MRELYQSPYYAVTVDDTTHMVRAVRSPTPFRDLQTVTTEVTAMVEKLRGTLDGPTHVLLIDMRRGPMRNDPAFEDASRPIAELTRYFRRQAVLVKTATGQLQVKRLARERGFESHVFDDETDALEFLRS